MNEDTLRDIVLDERKFLHDISNHIVVAHGMATFVLKTLKENPSVEARELDRLDKSIQAINKITELLKERRTVLHSKTPT